ncbi:acetoacetate decarboxylase [Fusarium austroafricanum]|uniref:Acetoacetate decarboxylase n=1 Tax=Fusarium austroafricanum TaxID=2364996 RepID=A0A8H4NLL6_9HYPO|nr:acetoacetate decarboxylase [Fusarium austroafricanum]
MSFVANPAQVAAFKRRCSNPCYSQEGLVVEFATTREFIQSVLPPTLEPADEATGLINVSLWQSNVCGDFELSSVSLRCKADGVEGYWVLHLIVSEVPAITWGRETWGEVKKDGKARLMSNGTRKYGYAERAGVRLIEMDVDFSGNQPGGNDTLEWYDFEVKAFPNATGNGLEADPKLITLKVVDNSAVQCIGKGKVTLRGTRLDPLHTIPILSVGDFSYSTGTSSWSVQSERKLCAAEDYLPFFVFRHYDDVTTLQVGSGLESITSKEEDFRASEARIWMSKDNS